MKNFVIILGAICIFSLSAVPVLSAGYGPYEPPIPSPNILIDKKVGVPYTNNEGNTEYNYYDNLSSTDHRFKEKDYVFFRIRVKNTSEKTLKDVVIRDYKPAYIDLIEDPGYRDGDDLLINVGDLAPGEEKIYYVKARIVDKDRLTSDTNITCVVNKAKASNDEVSDEDSSQLCIEKEVTVETPEKIPETGAAENLIVLILSGMGIFIGKRLRKTNV